MVVLQIFMGGEASMYRQSVTDWEPQVVDERPDLGEHGLPIISLLDGICERHCERCCED